MSTAELERLVEAARRQPGARERASGIIKFQCPACAAEGHDHHQDNAGLFLHDGKWGCAFAGDTDEGRQHWEAIGRVLGAFNGRGPSRPTVPAAISGDDLGLVSVGELLGEPTEAHSWVVADRLPAAGLGLLAGKPKAGKSTAARCLALAVARGAPWLGFSTLAGPVIYLALEEKRQELRQHFRALGATAADSIAILCASAPVDALERLRREVERRRPVLIIIDPLFRFVRVDDGNDYATMTAALEPLMTLARETGACVLLVHHLGKGERADGDNVLGSTAIFAAVDSALLMKRTERYRTLSSIQRYGEDLEEITVTLDPETRNVSAGPPKTQAEQDEAGRLILEFLAGREPVTEAEIDGAIECRRQIWKKALRDLVGTGKVARTGRGGKADPFRYSGSLSISGNQGTRTLFPDLSADPKREDSGSQVPYSVQVPVVPVSKYSSLPPKTWP
jgi:hypothetical protein